MDEVAAKYAEQFINNPDAWKYVLNNDLKKSDSVLSFLKNFVKRNADMPDEIRRRLLQAKSTKQRTLPTRRRKSILSQRIMCRNTTKFQKTTGNMSVKPSGKQEPTVFRKPTPSPMLKLPQEAV